MDERIKQRLVGAVVLVSLVVIFAPMLLEDEPVVEHGIHKSNIPARSRGLEQFRSGVLPAPGQYLGPPPEPAPIAVSSAPAPSSTTVGTEPAPEPTSAMAARPEGPVSSVPPAAVSQVPATKPPAPAVPPPAKRPKPRVGVSAWVVQLGAFAKRDNADSLVKRLRQDHQEAFMEQVEIGDRVLFRVRVGPELDHKRAEAMLAAVRKILGAQAQDAQVVRYP